MAGIFLKKSFEDNNLQNVDLHMCDFSDTWNM